MPTKLFILDKFQITRVAHREVLGNNETNVVTEADAIANEFARQIGAHMPELAVHKDFASQMNTLFGMLESKDEEVRRLRGELNTAQWSRG